MSIKSFLMEMLKPKENLNQKNPEKVIDIFRHFQLFGEQDEPASEAIEYVLNHIKTEESPGYLKEGDLSLLGFLVEALEEGNYAAGLNTKKRTPEFDAALKAAAKDYDEKYPPRRRGGKLQD